MIAWLHSLRELAPGQMLLIACSASVVVMAVILMLQGRWHLVFSLSRKQYAQSFGMGLINPCLYYFLLFGAFDRLPAQEAQPLNYTWALVLAYMSVPFLGHRLRKLDIVEPRGKAQRRQADSQGLDVYPGSRRSFCC